MEAHGASPSSPSHNSPGSTSSLDDHHLSSSRTSESSQDSPAYKRPGLNDNSLHFNEAAVFFSNLDNYLPLGCLCFEDLLDVQHGNEPGHWREANQLPLLLGFDDTLYGHLQKLIAAGWICMLTKRSVPSRRFLIFRIYILPFDSGHRFVDRQNKRLHLALASLVTQVDVSRDAWEGRYVEGNVCRFDPFATQGEGSLFWLFNKLPSPSPSAELVTEKYAREALEDLLDPASVLPGLKTRLYPYQRRSAGLMLQRESVSTLGLDPRLEQRTAPDGSLFYFAPRDLQFLRQPRYYEACKGGILAETMGLGKTLMCLAVILATKDHPPIVPTVCALPPIRPSVASLADMAISSINRKSIPWRVELSRIKHASGDEMQSCRAKLEQNPAFYEIPVEPMRWNRKTIQPPPKKMILASTTLLVVPRNLNKQWQSEIKKHVESDVLRVLVMDDSKAELPAADQIRTYDIVLFTRGRFEAESKDGADGQGRRIGATQLLCRCPYIGATRTRDCHCIRTDDLYDSPLKHLHFKRLIIDEGQFFGYTNSTAVNVANKLVTADHRWVVSGTPAKDLLGVEVDMSAAVNLWHTPDTKQSREAVLQQRRHFTKDDTSGTIKSLSAFASFLRIKPWYTSDTHEGKVEWDEFVFRHEDLHKRTFSGFSSCMQRTLESMVVKTRPEDVERDIELPPLSHEVVCLEPSFYDKLTANLFTLVLTANAVTSERVDVDYLFHKNSQKSRSQLISNLRQSAFFWTGFSEADVLASLKSSNGYLAKEGTGCTASDRELLLETLKCADAILGSEGWKALSRSHELGLFVKDWPAESAEHWTFDGDQKPLLTGISQLLEAQKHVNERAGLDEVGEGLAGVGIKALASAKYGTSRSQETDKGTPEKKPILTKGIPTSSLDGEPLLKRRGSSSSKRDKPSPKKHRKAGDITQSSRKTPRPKQKRGYDNSNDSPSHDVNGFAAATQATELINESFLEPGSPYLESRIVGTTSAKLSYLISQILKHYKQEKILVFYDGENVAYYIAQMLELLHIKHEIYAKTLAAHLKAEYVVRFDQEAEIRVLLMDVRNAAFGLNIPSASRIFFINPVCRPNIEAQAIKRAHRIGQTRKVHVATLVLKGTIEEKMLERSKRMTRSEHSSAKVLEDDGGIRQIIQSAKVLPVFDHEKTGYGQMAPLEEPQQLWARPGWSSFTKVAAKQDASSSKKRKAREGDANDEEEQPVRKSKKQVVRRTLDFVNCIDTSNSTSNEYLRREDSDDEPIAHSWRTNSPTSPLVSHPMRPHSRNPFLPSILPFPGDETRLAGVELPSPEFEPVEDFSTEHTPPSDYRKLPISHVLNDETPTKQPRVSLASPELVRNILKRL